MSQDTVAVDGLESEVNKDDLEAAIGDALDEYDDTTGSSDGDVIAQVGSVAIKDDGYLDQDGYVVDLDAVAESTRVGLADLRDSIGEPEFAQFVEDEFGVEALDDTAYMESELDITTTQDRATLGRTVGMELDASEDVEITYITFGKNGLSFGEDAGDAQLRIGLNDTRE